MNNNYSNASLAFGLLSWVPLLNIFSAPLGVIFGIMALYKIRKSPKEFGGMIRAIIGLVVAAVWIIMTIVAVYIEGPSLFVRT